MTDTTDREIMQQALDELIENARLLGITQAKQGYGFYSQQDAIFERAFHECIAKHSAALRERLAQPDPRNQCGETCERAKLCAVCLAEMGAQPEQKPVTAQHRFRHPQKTMPDWSVWQKCRVSNRPAWEIDSQGYEVEYRNLYAAPPKREWQGLTDEEISAIIKNIPDETDLGVAKRVFAREIEAKLKEKND